MKGVMGQQNNFITLYVIVISLHFFSLPCHPLCFVACYHAYNNWCRNSGGTGSIKTMLRECYFKMGYQNQTSVSKLQASLGFFDEICAPTIIPTPTCMM